MSFGIMSALSNLHGSKRSPLTPKRTPRCTCQIVIIQSLQGNFRITGLYNGFLWEPIRSKSYIVNTFRGIGSIGLCEADWQSRRSIRQTMSVTGNSDHYMALAFTFYHAHGTLHPPVKTLIIRWRNLVCRKSNCCFVSFTSRCFLTGKRDQLSRPNKAAVDIAESGKI